MCLFVTILSFNLFSRFCFISTVIQVHLSIIRNMSDQKSDLVPLSHLNHNGHHRSKSHSHNHSHHSSIPQPSSKDWYSKTNKNGNLIIGQKNDASATKTSIEVRLERHIYNILAEFNPNARAHKIVETTNELMKEFGKFYKKTSRQNAASKNGSSKVQHDSNSVKIESQAFPKPKETKTSEEKRVKIKPKIVMAPVVKNVKQENNKLSKIPRELMALVNSDGFVSAPPSSRKRKPQKVYRYDDIQYEQPPRPSRRARRMSSSNRYDYVRERSIEREFVRPSFKQYLSEVQQKIAASATATRANQNPGMFYFFLYSKYSLQFRFQWWRLNALTTALK